MSKVKFPNISSEYTHDKMCQGMAVFSKTVLRLITNYMKFLPKENKPDIHVHVVIFM